MAALKYSKLILHHDPASTIWIILLEITNSVSTSRCQSVSIITKAQIISIDLKQKKNKKKLEEKKKLSLPQNKMLFSSQNENMRTKNGKTQKKRENTNLNRSDTKPASLEQKSDATSSDSFAEATDDATSHQNVLHSRKRFFPPQKQKGNLSRVLILSNPILVLLPCLFVSDNTEEAASEKHRK